jgi:hypothetical protein
VANSPYSSEQSPTRPTPTVSRRRFGRDAVLAGALTLSSASLLKGKENAIDAGPAPDLLGLEPDQAQDVEAKLSNIIRKYGDRLSFAQREHLRRILAYNEKMLASVRAFSLQNGDPPASVLRISFSGEPANTESHRSIKNKESRPLDEKQQEPT